MAMMAAIMKVSSPSSVNMICGADASSQEPGGEVEPELDRGFVRLEIALGCVVSNAGWPHVMQCWVPAG